MFIQSFVEVIGGTEKIVEIQKAFDFDAIQILMELQSYERNSLSNMNGE